MKTLVFFLGLALLETAPQGTSQTESLCTVLADAALHDGSVVTVEGVYLRVPHGSIITAPDCSLSPRAVANVRLAADFRQKDRVMKTLWSLTEKQKPVKVVLKGTLHVAKKEQGFGQGVEPYEIEVVKYLAAEPYIEHSPDQPKP